MKPAFRITANGADITKAIAGRLVELSITDEAGIKSDRLTLELDDRDQLLELPSKGAKLQAAIGYEGAPLVEMGAFVVDEVEVTGGPATLTIRASATDFTGGISAPRERSWHFTTLGAIVEQIAAEHGLLPVVDPELAGAEVQHADQTESDIQFLTRLAQQRQAVVKTPEGRLVLAKRGRTKAVSGASLPAITISPGQGASWRMVTAGRGDYGAVRAYWHDLRTAQRREVVVGQPGGRVQSLTKTYPTEDEAREAAASKLKATSKGKDTLTVSAMPGNPRVAAEQPVQAVGFRAGVDGEWVATRVEHKISGSGGYTTDLECELPG